MIKEMYIYVLPKSILCTYQVLGNINLLQPLILKPVKGNEPHSTVELSPLAKKDALCEGMGSEVTTA